MADTASPSSAPPFSGSPGAAPAPDAATPAAAWFARVARHRAVWAALGMALLAAPLGAPPASAAPSGGAASAAALDPTALTGLLLHVPGERLDWTNSLTGPILPSALNPGGTTSSVIGLRNATDGPVTLSLKARDISGDDTLADHIRFTVRRDPERDGTFEATPVFSGTLPKLGHGTPLAGVELPAHSAWDYQVEATIDADAGNEVAGKEVAFTLAWISTGDDGSTTEVTDPDGPPPGSDTGQQPVTAARGTTAPVDQGPGTHVLGDHTQQPPASTPRRGLLPITGRGLGWLLAGGTGLALTGLILGRTRRRPTPSA